MKSRPRSFTYHKKTKRSAFPCQETGRNGSERASQRTYVKKQSQATSNLGELLMEKMMDSSASGLSPDSKRVGTG
jgi:hypothetical protein